MADILATQDKKETRIRPTTTLRHCQTQGRGKTAHNVRRRRAGATKAEVGIAVGVAVGVATREGYNKQCKDYTPRLDDAPSGHIG